MTARAELAELLRLLVKGGCIDRADGDILLQVVDRGDITAERAIADLGKLADVAWARVDGDLHPTDASVIIEGIAVASRDGEAAS